MNGWIASQSEPQFVDSNSIDILIGSDGPERLEGRDIRLPLPCSRCGYDLQGLPAMAVCPECGVPASRSLEAAIDPTTHRLPPLLSPGVVGQSLLMLGVLAVLASLMLGIHTAVSMPWSADAMPGLARPLAVGSIVIAIACGILACIPVVRMWPSPGTMEKRGGRRGLGLLSLGLLVWTVGCILVWYWSPTGVFGLGLVNLVPLLGGVGFLIGLRRILIEVGSRSRVFRTDRTRRQRIWDLVIGILFISIGILLTTAGESLVSESSPGWWSLGLFTFTGRTVSGLAFVGVAMSAVAIVLVLVGLLYLLANLAWVRLALQSPPPRLREYLGPPQGS